MFGIVPTIQATSNDPVKEGYQDGREDALQGNSKNSYCDPDNSDPNPDLYCAIIKHRMKQDTQQHKVCMEMEINKHNCTIIKF